MANMFNSGLYALSDSAVGFKWNDAGVTIYCCLVTSAYTFDATDNVYGDLSGEITNTGYSAGGNAVASRTCTEDDSNNRVIYDAADVAFTTLSAGDQPYAAICYKNNIGSPKTLISYNILTTPPMPNGGTYTIVWHATTGVFVVTNS